jgi:muramoyltetrapeptide carboxypeptidase
MLRSINAIMPPNHRVDGCETMCVYARMTTSRRFPPRLREGSRIGLVAPSGSLGAQDLKQSIENVRSFGWEAVPGEHVRKHDGYLAGSDAHRLADLNRFAADESIDAVWCVRGGYGATRLLDELDYDAWARRPRAIIGYSDITALHSAIGERADVVTYHGPTARGVLTSLTRASFADAVTLNAKSPWVISGGMTTLRGGRARGRLAGGNLSLVTAMMGTPYEWDLDGAILVLEDVLEAVYRIDRMLTQIKASGALARVAGIAFGQFTEIPHDVDNAERPLERVLREFAEWANVPCVGNFPIGHVPDHVTLPLGAIAELDADRGTLTIDA